MRSRSLPAVWAMNHLRVALALPFDTLVELADEQLAGSRYVHITLENQEAGPALEDDFRAAGWKIDRELLMVMSAAPDRDTDTSIVVGARGRGHGTDAALVWRGRSRPARARPARGIVPTRDAGLRRSTTGRPELGRSLVAMSKLRSDGRVAQVEDVYTVPEARGRGFGRAVVARAVELARDDGHDLIFIDADDNDWPKQLYARVGFRPFGRIWQFHHD